MCGIAGIIGPGAERYIPNVQAMMDAMAHRGPDGEGLAVFANCVLGHRRLSIIDLEGGIQPIYSTDKQKAITCNGEIYGYQAIRSKINYPYQTNTDTELILALQAEYDEKYLEHIPGMFAFGIWDDIKQTLYAARDRFGEKPFYYAVGQGGELVFASEIKGVLASGLVKGVLDLQSMAHYLRHLYVPVGKSIYGNIYSLLPGHSLEYSPKQGAALKQIPYWTKPEPTVAISLDEATEEFSLQMKKAVQRQMVADVSVGAFLSGGIDSSTVVNEAVQIQPVLKTFSFAFRNGADESAFAREVARASGTQHFEYTDEGQEIASLILKMADIYDEPFADSSNIPTWLLAHQASKEVKVALGGDGGDELLGGYAWYKDSPSHQQSKSLLASIKARLSSKPANQENISPFMCNAHSQEAISHAGRNVFFKADMLKAMGLGEGLIPAKDLAQYRYNTLEDAMRMDIDDYLPGDILCKTDRACMAHGLELRSPFLDVDLASFCLSLPIDFKIKGKEDKIMLRKAYGNRLPKNILMRAKQGFGAPVNQWLLQKDMQALKMTVLHDKNNPMYQLLDYKATLKLAQNNN